MSAEFSPSPPHIPLLRHGEPYRSLSSITLTDVRSGEPVVEVSQANPGLIARDLNRSAEARRRLDEVSTGEWIDLSKRAAELFLNADLALGETTQSPETYLAQLAATTGMPQSLGRKNMAKAAFVMAEMETVLGGLTRGLDPAILDRGHGEQDGRPISYRRQSNVLGAVLPSNSPGVHSLWIPALALKTALALKPGRREPWTPYRIAQAYLAAGCPPEAFSLYPTSHAGAAEILARTGRSMLYGDTGTVAPWRADPRVQIHGPGWSKVVFGDDTAPDWHSYLDLVAASIADNGGRSCINASGVWTPSHGDDIALGLAERMAAIEARGLDDPEAALAAQPSRAAAERLSDWIDARLADGGAEDVTARFRPAGRAGRVAEADGCWFVLPTVVRCDADHPFARTELLLPFASVVEVPRADLVERLEESLVVSALTADPALRAELLHAPWIERLNLGPFATSHVAWDQPHEGNLFEHLFQQRAYQDASMRLPSPPEAVRQEPRA